MVYFNKSMDNFNEKYITWALKQRKKVKNILYSDDDDVGYIEL